ncbi:potassium channel family protein [Oceanobacillus caeni]
MTIKFIKYLYLRLPLLIKLLLLVIIVMLFYGILIHFIEPKQFPTIFDGIWWAFVTAATVGYGDYTPLTTEGRIVGILLMLTGGSFIALYVSAVSSRAVRKEQDLIRGKLKFKGQNHLIFIGWNERTRQLIEIVTDIFPNLEIVLIDHSEKKISYQNYPVHFINGDATEDYVLHMANIKHASRVLISANDLKSERHSDNWTILATLAIRGNNKDVPIVAEILSKVQIENALRAGATTIIRSNNFMSILFFHELSHKKTATPFEDITNLLKQKQFSHSKCPVELTELSFLDVSQKLLKRGHLLLGIIRNNQYQIHPSQDFIIKKEDILLSITDW